MRLDALVESHGTRTQRLLTRIRRLVSRTPRVNRLFVFLVVVPTAVAVLYFGLLAHDVYVSESQFVVRTVQRQLPTGLGSLLQGSGLTQGSNDVYSVQSFLNSRDALQILEQRYHLKRSFGSRAVDVFARFDPLGWDDSFESLLRYYQKFVVNSDLDSTSSILTLTVRAFSAEESQAINEALLKMSEDFVNRLNDRARNDLVRFATADVESAEKQQRAAVLALSQYRNKQALYDPGMQSDLQLRAVGALREELVTTRKQLADVRTMASDNPQIPVLQSRIRVLQGEIESEMAKVAGDRSSLSSKVPQYEAITLDRDFAAKYLTVALDSLEQARENAMSQQLYIERIEEPNKPDVPIEPRALRDIAATLLVSLIVWAVTSLMVTAVKEHSE
jgi:capsular polysaccharide transport system permease protein